MKKFKKLILSMITIICIATFTGGDVFALSWSGSSNIGDGNSEIATAGFSVPYTSESDMVGYRFSVVDKNKNTVLKKDYLRGNNSYMTTYSNFLVSSASNEVQNKYQLKSNYNGAYSTTYKYIPTYSALPSVGSIKTWVVNNSDSLLKSMGFVNGTEDMVYGDRLLVEPLFMVVINNEKLTMTISDISIIGCQVFGKTGDVYNKGWTNGTWGFLASYTQKFFPNYLHTNSDSHLWSDLWGNAPTLSSVATFGTLLDNGYGVGVAFQSYKDPNIDVTLKYWKYSFSEGKWIQFDTKTASTTDVSSYTPEIITAPSNYYYKDWGYQGSNIFHVNYWQNIYYVSYHANGGSNAPSSQTKYGGVNLTLSSQKPTKTGYIFKGWGTSASDTTPDYQPSSTYSSNSSSTLYAVWEAIPQYTFDINAYLNNTFYGGTYDWATFDVYINGTKVADDVNDYYQYHYKGSTYEIKDIKPASGKKNNRQTSYSGTINSTSSVDLNILSLHEQKLNFYKYNPTNGSWTLYTSKSYTKAYGETFTATTSGVTTPTGYHFSHFNESSWIVKGDYWTNGHYYPNEYTVSYNANGGSNAPSSQIKYYGYDLTISSQKPTKTGYVFKGWGTSASDTTPDYQPNGTYSSNSAITLYAIWEIATDLYPEFIEPNATYYAGTEVIASFDIVNNGPIDFTFNDDVDVKIKAYSISNSNVTTLILDTAKSIVIPKNEQNIAYWKISIPIDSKKIKYVVTVSSSATETDSSNNTITNEVNVSKLVNSQTADTNFEDSPTGFTVPSTTLAVPTMGQSLDDTANWSEWVWQNGSFAKKNYGFKLQLNVDLSADTACETETVNGNITTMKSGYGIQTEVTTSLLNYGANLMPNSSAYTEMQSANMYFPEFGYSNALNKYRTLTLVDDSLYFEKNENTMTQTGVKDYRRTHFIPIYFPDTNYVVKTYGYNMWTPVGMINAVATTNQIKINGDIYDDWEITTH